VWPFTLDAVTGPKRFLCRICRDKVLEEAINSPRPPKSGYRFDESRDLGASAPEPRRAKGSLARGLSATSPAMRLRLLLCLAFAVGFGALAITKRPKEQVQVTYDRTETFGGQEGLVCRIRNETPHPVTIVGYEEADGLFSDAFPWEEVGPHSNAEWTALLRPGNAPRSVYLYVAPWTFAERESALERYSRLPKPIREWLMRKYDWNRPAYRHQVEFP